jgi:hypothetical protein
MKLRGQLLAALLCAALALAACSRGESSGAKPSASNTPARAQSNQSTPPRLDVPYVPTPNEVVALMLETAKVGKDDIVYDLGSGDGRIVVTAAKERGARGVGYDIDPQRIAEANANAQKAGVTDRVRFVQGDLFQADLSEATVVTLYLLPDINLKLRPKLLAELKPGTRVVSHNYDMGDWEPLSSQEIEAGGSTHYVYYWVVPPRKEGAQQPSTQASPAR